MRRLIESIEVEFRRYKTLGEGAMAQLGDEELTARPAPSDSSIATIVWHVSGNLISRFTDFLTSDGEKPWRDRDSEFGPRDVDRSTLTARWEEGWTVLLETLAALSDADLDRTVTIRNAPLQVHEALHRSLAHTSYHVGQIVYLAKMYRGEDWASLSIPPGGSAAYNRNPTMEKGRGR